MSQFIATGGLRRSREIWFRLAAQHTLTTRLLCRQGVLLGLLRHSRWNAYSKSMVFLYFNSISIKSSLLPVILVTTIPTAAIPKCLHALKIHIFPQYPFFSANEPRFCLTAIMSSLWYEPPPLPPPHLKFSPQSRIAGVILAIHPFCICDSQSDTSAAAFSPRPPSGLYPSSSPPSD